VTFLLQIIMLWKAEFWDVVYIKIYVYEIPIFRWLPPIICKIRSMQLHIFFPWVKPVWEIEVWGQVKKKYNKDTKERKIWREGYFNIYDENENITFYIVLHEQYDRVFELLYCWWVNMHQTLERYFTPCALCHVLNYKV
jgi:hypothetical protein